MTTTAIDIGGSGIRGAHISTRGTVEDVKRINLAGDTGLSGTEEAIRSAISDLGGTVSRAVGVAVPSRLTDGIAREVFSRPALEGLDIARWAGRMTGLPSFAYMDIDAAAYAEATVGAASATSRLLCITLGTGASAAMTVDGSLDPAGSGRLFNAGHIYVGGSEACPCGGTGCLEVVCSGGALREIANGLGLSGVPELARAAKAGMPGAAAAFAAAGSALGRLIAIIHMLQAPDRTVLTGGLMRAGELLTSPMRIELERVCGDRLAPPLGPIIVSDMPMDAALIGAGLLAARDQQKATTRDGGIL